jgi:hypothetical protein
MPNTLSRADRIFLAACGGMFILVVSAAVLFARGASDTSELPSSYSSASTGARAAFLTLQASGYRAERWSGPLDEIPDSASATLILAEPTAPATPSIRRQIQHFLAQGGWIIATGLGGARFLSEEAVPHPVRGLTWVRVPAAALSSITRAAPEITVAPQAAWDAERPALVLYAYQGEPIVVQIEVGHGRAFWWAAATPLTNAGLREPGNLEFLLASLGPRNQRRILFNEAVHGPAPGTLESIVHSPAKWLVAQGGLLALTILFTFSRRSGPIMIPAVETRLSPVEFVKTLGSLYQRAGASSVAVEIAARRFRFLLARSFGIPRLASADAIEAALRRRTDIDAAAVAATLRACDEAGDRVRLDPKEALSLIRSLGRHIAALRLIK